LALLLITHNNITLLDGASHIRLRRVVQPHHPQRQQHRVEVAVQRQPSRREHLPPQQQRQQQHLVALMPTLPLLLLLLRVTRP
jgi:hypothetical protein